ncbi:MAG: hypothetical protein ACYCXK_01225 [Candidatus Humimicrobiaceae bacterium]
MYITNRNKIVSFIILIFFITAIVLPSISCNISSGSSSGNKSSGVISLFDSLEIGDVPSFPGSRLDVDLYRNLDSVLGELPKMPELFSDSGFFTYVTKSSPEDVTSYYHEQMKILGWEFVDTYDYGDQGSFTIWQKMANTGKYVTYGVFAGDYLKNGKTVTLILNGFIIPENETDKDDSIINQKEEINPEGTIYFENKIPPAGQGLLITKPISMGIEEWETWLQEGSKEKGTNKVSIVDDPKFYKVVQFQRSSDPDDGGAAGIFQETDISVSQFNNLYIWLVGKIDSENGGNIANAFPKWFPEGALQVRIKYSDDSGAEKEWYHGFYYSDIENPDSLHFSKINKGDYFWYISPDMMIFENKPVIIKEVKVYGFGWDFSGSIADINLIGQ